MNNQLFLCLHITVEVDDLGKFTLDQRYFPVNLDAYDLAKASTYLKLGLQGFVAFWVFYYIVEEVKQMRQLGLRSYFSESACFLRFCCVECFFPCDNCIPGHAASCCWSAPLSAPNSPAAVWNCIDVLNLILFLVSGFLQFQAVMLLRSMNADAKLVSTPKLLATGDYTDSYTMINSVNALVVGSVICCQLCSIFCFSNHEKFDAQIQSSFPRV
jgi:hypothetical protein